MEDGNDPGLTPLAMRAVELAVRGGRDPRLLVATKRRAANATKVARLLAGLVNGGQGRRTVLLLGVGGRAVSGLGELPDDDWWAEVRAELPGRVPELAWTVVDIDGAQVLAIAPSAEPVLVAAYRGSTVEVPLFDGERLVPHPVHALAPATEPATPAEPGARVRGGWLERVLVGGDDRVAAYRGQIELELTAVAGTVLDDACAASLLLPWREQPIELAVQLHPATDDTGVRRLDDGIEVRVSLRVRVYVAGAITAEPTADVPPGAAQLVLSLPAPGAAEPGVWSLLLRPDRAAPGTRWTL